jgi:hypothetical protein
MPVQNPETRFAIRVGEVGVVQPILLAMRKPRLERSMVANASQCAGNISKWVRIRKAAEATGYTEKAIRQKIDKGVWLQGVC